jgi:DNA-binding winged helix-turn-helix (wHTH) protein/tetratricopeptide (TPR) repeat protein
MAFLLAAHWMPAIGLEQRGDYAFGRFRLSADGTLLLEDGAAVELAPKVLQTLLVLVRRAGEVVQKPELLRAVWPDSVVEETGLTRNVSLLRQALGDREQRLIKTVARVGYRFTALVTRVEPTSGGSTSRRRLLVLPFRWLHDDRDAAFLALSLPDAVRSALCGLESLVVRSSLAAGALAGESPDLARLAAEVDVDTLLAGTLLRSGNLVLVNAELLAAPSGTVLWSGSLRAPLDDVFRLQDGIVRHVVRALALSLSASERVRLEGDVPASPAAFEFYLRGNESVGLHAIGSAADLRVARELYSRSVQVDPQFAPAWARLGRCHYLIAKFEGGPASDGLELAESCFRKALELSPELPLAHSLYALLEVDRGRALGAMQRLVRRGLAGSSEPELFAALVQACRYCGLLEPSVAAHERARSLDRAQATGVYHTLWQLGDLERAQRETVRAPILEALVVAGRGEPGRAAAMLREREERGATGLLRRMMASHRGVFEKRRDVTLENAEPVFEALSDPEAVYYVARTVAFFGEPRALAALSHALEHGYGLFRPLVRADPWLDPLRAVPAFGALRARAREAYVTCVDAYMNAGGERLLGPVPGPDEIELGRASAPQDSGGAA